MDFYSTKCNELYDLQSTRTTYQFQQWRRSISNLMSEQLLDLVNSRSLMPKQVQFDDVGMDWNTCCSSSMRQVEEFSSCHELEQDWTVAISSMLLPRFRETAAQWYLWRKINARTSTIGDDFNGNCEKKCVKMWRKIERNLVIFLLDLRKWFVIRSFCYD